jgi:hypothetical protein
MLNGLRSRTWLRGDPGFRVAPPVVSVAVIDVIGNSRCVANIRQRIAAYLSVVGARFRTNMDIAFQGVSGQALLVSPPSPRAKAAEAPRWSRKDEWRMELKDHAPDHVRIVMGVVNRDVASPKGW